MSKKEGILDEFGNELVKQTINRSMNIYKGLLCEANNPLRKNELLSPILEKLGNVDKEALIELLDHFAVHNTHAFLDFIENGRVEPSGCELSIILTQPNGTKTFLLDICDSLGGELVDEGGWVDLYVNH